MKTNLLILMLMYVALLAGCKHEKQLSGIINNIGKEFAPEKRESVFNISYKRIGSKTYTLTGEVSCPKAKAALLETLLKQSYKINDSINVLPQNVTKPWALITLSVANLRASPSHSSELLTQALMGTPVKILKEQSGWAYIQTPDNYLSWCEKIALSFKDENEMEAWKLSERLIFFNPTSFIINKQTRLNISDVVAGCILVKTGESNGETDVELPDGRTGVIQLADVKLFTDWSEQIQPLPDALKNSAIEFMGIPYLWGGTSFKAVDCSGFVKMVYFLNGVVLARDASLQVKYGTNLPIENGWQDFQIGDLIFFSSKPKGDRITHVGMYIGHSEKIGRAHV